ncbi:phosphoribosylanthranilate isomerase [Arenimonas sp.]|jgi:phosphoribosylanthranilate isomerase|uniref:phosphoribosylanthranilate isomerase n=1 Tax=Arenimonas sp. TaxID=1872635 RepID=UPI0037C01F6F
MSVRIKFCGFTRAEDAALAAALGVHAIGVVHVPGSKRHVPLEAMPAIRAAVPAHIELVALFVNPYADTVQAVIQALQPSLLQFHGDETDPFCAQFGMPFIKAMAMGEGAGDITQRQKDYPSAQALVLDGHAPGELGGQGERFAWTNLPVLDKPIYLAGGLHAGNVAEAIATVKPYAVDVSSGIESAPGVKDAMKMRDFIRAAHADEP